MPFKTLNTARAGCVPLKSPVSQFVSNRQIRVRRKRGTVFETSKGLFAKQFLYSAVNLKRIFYGFGSELRWRSVSKASSKEEVNTDTRQLREHISIPVNDLDTRPVIVQARMTHMTFAGWLGSMLLVCMVTIASVSAALTAFMLYLRPTLKKFEETCEATEKASKQLEIAAIEMEEAAITLDEKLPPTLKSVEHASREFEELGQSLNSLSGGLLSRRPTRHRRREKETHAEQHPSDSQKLEASIMNGEAALQRHQAAQPSTNITRQTMQSINKAAADLTSFTQSFRPAMDLWRKRLGVIVSNVEAMRHPAQRTTRQLEATPSGEGAENGVANEETMTGTSVVVDDLQGEAQGLNTLEDSDDFGDVGDLHIEDIFKDKDSLIARLANESTGETASEIMDALYKAEQAANDAARASDDLQDAVERAKFSGEWEDFITWSNDDDSPLSTLPDEFYEPNIAEAVRYDDPASAAAEDGHVSRSNNQTSDLNG